MNEIKINKIRKFLNDEAMANFVFEEFLSSFLKPRPHTDTQLLAASRIAIDLLHDARKDLNRYREETEVERGKQTQIGL